MDNLNARIDAVKNIIKAFPNDRSNDPEFRRITREFYKLVQGISKDIDSANRAVNEINILRKRMSENINRDSSRINDIFKELQVYTKNKASSTLKESLKDAIDENL